MATLNPLDLLNRLYALHVRSLPNYLANATPWSPSPDAPALTALRHIAEDQQLMADRIASVILEQGGTIAATEYPMEFTDLHDLSLDFLMPQVRERLEKEVEWTRNCVTDLAHAPAPKAIAEEALGAAVAHLDNLRDALRPTLGLVSHH